MGEHEVDEVSEALWAEFRDEVEKAWAAVFKLVNTLITQHDSFGFESIEKKANPSLPDILRGLKLLEAILDALPVDDLEYALSRMIINAKQQITHFELVVTALAHNRRDDYEAAMISLRSQAQF